MEDSADESVTVTSPLQQTVDIVRHAALGVFLAAAVVTCVVAFVAAL